LNNTAQATVAINMPNLTIQKTGPATTTAGGSIVYAITVSNTGSAPATNVTLTDPAPAGLAYVSATAPCTGGFPCNLGTVAPAGSITINATFNVASTVTGQITNTASVSSDQTTQTSSSASTVVGVPAPVVPAPALDLRGLLALAFGMLMIGAYRWRRVE
jgi:uncharacterized repeat protein (TIGR01451 family)